MCHRRRASWAWRRTSGPGSAGNVARSRTVRNEIVHLVVGVTDLGKALAVHDLVEDTRRSEMRGKVVGIVLAAIIPLDEGATAGRYDEIGGLHCVDQSVGALTGTGGGKEGQAEEGSGSASFAHGGCACCCCCCC